MTASPELISELRRRLVGLPVRAMQTASVSATVGRIYANLRVAAQHSQHASANRLLEEALELLKGLEVAP